MLDYLILLLSTDWFLPYWADFGINTDENTKNNIQLGCRQIAAQMLAGAESYYQIDFSLSRRAATHAESAALLRECVAHASASQTFDEWSGLTHTQLSKSTFYASMTTQLVVGVRGDKLPELDSGIHDVVVDTWQKYSIVAGFFPTKSLESQTGWDFYSRSVFDPPDTLGNQAWAVMLSHRFEEFWKNVGQHLSSNQLASLRHWYRSQTVHLLGEERPDLIPGYIEDPS